MTQGQRGVGVEDEEGPEIQCIDHAQRAIE